MKVNIRYYKVKNGKQLFIDINHQGERKKQNLDGLILTGNDKLDGIVMAKAEAYKENYMKTYNPATIFSESYCAQNNIIDCFNQFRDQYPYDSQKGKINGLRDSFVKFINSLGLDVKKYYINMLSPNTIMQFRDYLISVCEGEGAKNKFSKFKDFLRYYKGLVMFDIAYIESLGVKVDKESKKKKDYITIEELDGLIKYINSKPNVSETDFNVLLCFALSCLTALRFGDIEKLNYINGILKQNKTDGEITIFLNKPARLLVERYSSSIILPSNNYTNQVLEKYSPILFNNKQITFHCARKSFITNVFKSVGDDGIKNICKATGHKNERNIFRYLEEADIFKTDIAKCFNDLIA